MSLTQLFVVALLCTSFCSADHFNTVANQNVIPKSYHIRLRPSLEDGNYSGIVSITFNFQENETVYFHSHHNLTVNNVILTKILVGGGSEVMPIHKPMKIAEDIIKVTRNDDQMPKFRSAHYNLTIFFEGKLRDDMTGFYGSYYNRAGVKRLFAVTQFEPTYARRAFPCFDEPKFRTKFTLDIEVPSQYEVISNVKGSINPADLGRSKDNTLYHFDQYPEMPTYLLAWVIFDKETFKYNTKTKNGIEYKVWAQADYVDQTLYSLDEAPKLLDALSGYLNIPYTLNNTDKKVLLQKMDQVAVPHFNFGAMENWGLVTYRESSLLCSADHSTSEDRRRTTMVIAHEFAHQWFGNLVTLESWRYTWLNEAFARYFQYFITLKVHPDWGLEEQFVVSVLQSALMFDSNKQNALTSDVTSEEEARKKFNKISYDKGASFIRMLEHVLKQENFKSKLSSYLENTKEGVTVPDKLLDILSPPQDLFSGTSLHNVSSPFDKFWESWTKYEGYPVVVVTRDNHSKVVLKQIKIGYNDKLPKKLPHLSPWYIPLTYTTKTVANFSDTTIADWLSAWNESVHFTVAPEDWIMFNIQQKGFYRVLYDNYTLTKIIDQLHSGHHHKIGTINRAQLIDDSFYFVNCELLHPYYFLNITKYLKNETDYAPWQSAVTVLKKLLNQYHRVPVVHKLLSDYMLDLINPVVEHVGFSVKRNAKLLQNLTRITVLNFAGELKHPKALNVSHEIVNDLSRQLDDLSSPRYSPDIQQALLCTGLKNSNNREEWENIYALYKTTSYAKQKILLLSSLTCTKNHELLKKLLDDTIKAKPSNTADVTVRPQDASLLFKEIGSTLFGAKFLLNYVKDNSKQIVDYFHNKTNKISGIISDIVNDMSDFIHFENEMDGLIPVKISSAEMLRYGNITIIISKIKERNETIHKHKNVIKRWLETSLPSNSTVLTDDYDYLTEKTPNTSSSVTMVYNISLMFLLVIYNFI